MQRDVHSKPSPPPSGGMVRLQARVTDLTSWLGPTWAAVCGIVASGGFHWQGRDWLRLALLILLVDGGWGTLWAALGGTDWATPLHRWRQSRWRHAYKNTSTATLPFTLPGAPGGRLSHFLGRLQIWWREVLWPTCGSNLLTVAVALPVTALLAALLSPELLLLSVAALAVMQLGVVWEGGREIVPPGWDALIAVALPWLAGHLTFGPITVRSAGLAALFALAWGEVWQITWPGGRALALSSQLLAMAALVALRRPLAAGTLFLLLIPQLALVPWTLAAQPATWYVRHARPWLMVAMAVAALAL